MKEFIDKLIERLEELQKLNYEAYETAQWNNDKIMYINASNAYANAITEVNQLAEEYNNGWIPCEKEMPPQPKENPLFENKPLELYLVTLKNQEYSFRAFWNGKFFTDGWGKVDATAWQPLPQPYQPKGE